VKAQISRDSFKEEKQYSAVYQQQGRMLTDADWNEMVRILKNRMDKTIGAAIKSGSPKEGGILGKDVIKWEWSSPKEPFKQSFNLAWGRIYVDGMYGEIHSKNTAAPSEQSIGDIIVHQRDFPDNPANCLVDKYYYVAYIDLWERLVVALEDSKHLLDPAFHSADTCVRTQTMAQIKLTKLGALKDDETAIKAIEKWEDKLANPKVPENKKPLIPRGNATLINPNPESSDPATGAGHNYNEEVGNRGTFNHKNALFRLEVHESSQYKVVLKWSAENGAEHHSNSPEIPNFWNDNYVYECYSVETEKHKGQHLLEGVIHWNSKKAKLYTYKDYINARKDSSSPANNMPYVRRWDGYVTLKWLGEERKWEVDDKESNFGRYMKVDFPNNSSSEGSSRDKDQKLVLENTELVYKLELSTVTDNVSKIFMPGDYWFVLLRDKGMTLSAEVLSAEPVGIHHHYLVLGIYKTIKRIGRKPTARSYMLLTPKQWRRLSFPSLTNLTLDRVLV